MTPLVEVQRQAFAIAAAWERGMQPPIVHPYTVVLLDDQGEQVGEVPAVNPMAATNITRALTKAGWQARTDGYWPPIEDGCE